MPKLGSSSRAVAFFIIDIFILLAYLMWELVLGFVNALGWAWWAKLETNNPKAVYWFGPFVTRGNLKEGLTSLVLELEDETSSSVKETILRCRCNEPFTSI